MRKRSTAPPPEKGPPKTIEAGAALISQHAIKLYDRQDGKGVDWGTVGTALFKAGFDAFDQMPEGEGKEKLAWRIHAAIEKRATGGYAVSDGGPDPAIDGSVPNPANAHESGAAPDRPPRPKGPR